MYIKIAGTVSLTKSKVGDDLADGVKSIWSQGAILAPEEDVKEPEKKLFCAAFLFFSFQWNAAVPDSGAAPGKSANLCLHCHLFL